MFNSWLPAFIKAQLPQGGDSSVPVFIAGVPDFASQYCFNQLGVALGCSTPITIIPGPEEVNGVLSQSGRASASKPVKAIEGVSFDVRQLVDLGYSRVGRVVDPGDYSVYGDVVVLWCFGWSDPVRLSLLGDEVESIEIVEKGSLKKGSELFSFAIPRNKSSEDGLFDMYIGNEIGEPCDDTPSFVYVKGSSFMDVLDAVDGRAKVIDFRLTGIPMSDSLARHDHALEKVIEQYKSQGYRVNYITLHKDALGDEGAKLGHLIDKTVVVDGASALFTRGVVSEVSKEVYLTDFEVLGEINLSDGEILEGVGTPLAKRNEIVKRDEVFKRIAPGDFVVHEDHGVGRYEGVVDRKGLLYMELAYKGKDRLYVPTSQGKKVTKYVGAQGKGAVLTPLNSGTWRRIKRKAMENAQEVAKELVQLYAMRKLSHSEMVLGSQDDLGHLQEFIDGFRFQDTPDQLAATHEIIEDLQGDSPMDRLIVGDVGFGKTEVAMRAMYAVVSTGKQVALLAPTTILVEQHLSVIKDRFKDSGLRIESMSRFHTKSELSQIAERLGAGKIDIVVGTHSLLSKSVKFDNLGLIVIDEEQKFGVKQKELLKSARINAHVLALSATPIPRTLNMSLSGIRDISVITTPPRGRKAIKNRFAKMDWDRVKEALQKELDRDGQAYFLHNRVETIDAITKKISMMFPDKNVQRGHGQLPADELSFIMHSFGEKEIDILVCTTIIENGIDLPNVNTLIVNDAQRFGLSQLYQIRGRIGRSSKQAYAHFLYGNLRGDAGKRMDALAQSEELGSGMLLSSRDMEIRGAGDILGREQSGSIGSVGYGLYISLLHEKVEELKEKL